MIGISLVAIIPVAFAEYDDTVVLIETNSGNLVIEFFHDDAPLHVEKFVELSQRFFYDDTIFHRIIPGFMIQGGDPFTKTYPDDPSVWGTGSPGYYIEAEFNDIKHKRGIVSMARSQDPNSAGSQFFIVHNDSSFLDGQYTVFGRLATQESFDTLDRIASLQTGQKDIPIDREAAKIINTTVMDRSDIDDLLEANAPETSSSGFVMKSDSGPYIDQELGFSIVPAPGWSVQNPPQVNSDSPTVAVVGPVVDEIPAAFTVNVKDSTSSLEDHVKDLDRTLQPGITAGSIQVISEALTQHKGLETYSLVVYQNFTLSETETTLIKINVFMIKSSDKLYTLQFTNLGKNYDTTEKEFRDMLNSFTVLGSSITSESESATQTESTEGGGCLIATAAYGSEMAPQVQFLREIRDNTVLQTQSGTSFMTAFNSFYYTFSPTIADYERENPVFKEAVKVGLTPLLTSLTILNYVDIDTEQEMLGYGIGIIMLNIGMYFVAPAIVVVILKNRRGNTLMEKKKEINIGKLP